MKPGWGNSSSQHRGGGHFKPRPSGEGLGWGLHASEHARPSGPAPPPQPSPTGREEGQPIKVGELQQVHYFHPCRAWKFCKSFARQMQQSRAGGAASGSGCRVRARAKLAGGEVRHGRSVAGWGRVGKWDCNPSGEAERQQNWQYQQRKNIGLWDKKVSKG